MRCRNSLIFLRKLGDCELRKLDRSCSFQNIPEQPIYIYLFLFFISWVTKGSILTSYNKKKNVEVTIPWQHSNTYITIPAASLQSGAGKEQPDNCSSHKALNSFHFSKLNDSGELSVEEKNTSHIKKRTLWEGLVLLFLTCMRLQLLKCFAVNGAFLLDTALPYTFILLYPVSICRRWNVRVDDSSRGSVRPFGTFARYAGIESFLVITAKN